MKFQPLRKCIICNGVIIQNGVRRICPYCSGKREKPVLQSKKVKGGNETK